MAESECAWVCDGKVIFCAPTSKRADSWKISRNLPVTACLDALLLYQRRLAPRQPEVREPDPVVDESFRKLLHTELIAKKRRLYWFQLSVRLRSHIRGLVSSIRSLGSTIRVYYVVLKLPAIQLRCTAAHLTASRLPLATSTPNHMTRDAAVHIPNKNGKPCQLSCVLSMIAWTT